LKFLIKLRRGLRPSVGLAEAGREVSWQGSRSRLPPLRTPRGSQARSKPPPLPETPGPDVPRLRLNLIGDSSNINSTWSKNLEESAAGDGEKRGRLAPLRKTLGWAAAARSGGIRLRLSLPVSPELIFPFSTITQWCCGGWLLSFFPREWTFCGRSSGGVGGEEGTAGAGEGTRRARTRGCGLQGPGEKKKKKRKKKKI